MKRKARTLLLLLLVFASLCSLPGCDMDADTTTVPADSSTGTTAPDTQPEIPDSNVTEPEVTENKSETYTAIVTNEYYNGSVDEWEITNVISESVYLSEMGEYRVYYTSSGCVATTLVNFTPDQYGYIGRLSKDDGGGLWYLSGTIKDYAESTWVFDEAEEMEVQLAGATYTLPDGAWFFGTSNMGNSFIIIVNDAEAEANKTVPFPE